MRSIEAKGLNESGKAPGVLRHPIRFGWIRRLATARCIPGDNFQLVGQRIKLPAPHTAVPEKPVQQDERRSRARAPVSDAEPVNLELFHPSRPAGIRQWMMSFS